MFYEKGIELLKDEGVFTYISPSNYLTSSNSLSLREFLLRSTTFIEIIDYEESDQVFENVTQAVLTIVLRKSKSPNFSFNYHKLGKDYEITEKEVLNTPRKLIKGSNSVIKKINSADLKLNDFAKGWQGEINVSTKKVHFESQALDESYLPLIRGNQVERYNLIKKSSEYCSVSVSNRDHHLSERVVFQEVSNAGLNRRLKANILNKVLCGHTTNYVIPKNNKDITIYTLLALLNSSLLNYYFKFYNQTNHVPIGEVKMIPVPNLEPYQEILDNKAKELFNVSNSSEKFSIIHQDLDNIIYKIYGLTFEQAKMIDPNILVTEEEYKELDSAITP